MKTRILILSLVTIVGALALWLYSMKGMDHSQMNMGDASPAASSQSVYICPMHPHIEGEHDSNCPICGMDLQPVERQNSSAKHISNQEREVLYWYDPMVPATKFDKPGKSPFMDMDLVPAYADEASEDEEAGSIKVPASLIQRVGVKTAPVELQTFGNDVRAYGRIVPSSRVANNVTLRVEGWVENLAASALGDVISKGQHLFDVNSPQLISAQTDYLTARKLENTDIAKAAASRLTQLGVDEKALSYIKKQSKPLTAVPIYAAAEGVITKLNINNGDYIKAGMPLLSIQDLSTVWVEADVPERDLKNLEVGNQAVVMSSESGEKRIGKITYIHPVVDPKTRTGQVRIELDNTDGNLKPDSFADVIFSSEKSQRIAVPTQAILRSSMGSYALLWLGEGRFKPVMVTTGAKSGAFIEILEGLKQGQEIVTSGQFLLDAEANLKTGLTSMESMEMKHDK